RLIHARDHVEDRGLARAVGPDQADDLAVVNQQVKLGKRPQAPERQREMLKIQNAFCRALAVARAGLPRRGVPGPAWPGGPVGSVRPAWALSLRAHIAVSTRRAPSSPCGRAFIITIRIAPIMSCLVIAGSVTSLVSHTNDARQITGGSRIVRQRLLTCTSATSRQISTTYPQFPATWVLAGTITQLRSAAPSQPVEAGPPATAR